MDSTLAGAATKPKEEMKVKVFGNTIVVSQQAKVAFWGYVITFLSIVGITLLSAGKGIFTPARLAMTFITAVFFAAYLLVGLYILNCTVTGQCNILAWVITALVLFMAAVYVTIFIASFGAVGGKK